jgi:ADP-ribosylglycohydrolase
MPIPVDYLERVYAGVLGKIIGVYLGRPIEGWSYERIMAELGEINYYVHGQRGVPLVVPRRRHLRHVYLPARATRLR